MAILSTAKLIENICINGKDVTNDVESVLIKDGFIEIELGSLEITLQLTSKATSTISKTKDNGKEKNNN